MKYSRGDIVEFKVGRDVHRGDVQFIEEDQTRIYYINSFSGWAFKVPENKIISNITKQFKPV